MSKYESGDYIKVEFEGEAGLPGEWMWVRVRTCDDQTELVFGTLDNEPLTDYKANLKLGSELVISYARIRDHKKSSEFSRS